MNIDIIYANSCIERMSQTLQDRLVKELRLEGIDTVHEGNDFLPGFIGVLNGKFAKESLNATYLYRPRTDINNLEDAMCWQESRTVFSTA